MALVDSATFKTQVAAMAAALTTAWSDTVATAIAEEIAHPSHPLRNFEKFFNFDPATGIVTSDDAYIDQAYAGVKTQKPTGFDKVTSFVVALLTSTVEDAAPSDIVLTFDQNLRSAPAPLPSDFTTGGTQTYSVIGVSIAGAVVTLTVDGAYLVGETITVTYTPGINPLRTEAGEPVAPFTAQAVTNNVV